jgi:hypothetical protein
MTPMEPIRANTGGSTAIANHAGEVGVIAPGKLADTVIVQGQVFCCVKNWLTDSAASRRCDPRLNLTNTPAFLCGDKVDDGDRGNPGDRAKPAKACRRCFMARVHRFRLRRDLGDRVLDAFGRIVSAQSAGCRGEPVDRQSHVRDEHGFRRCGTPAGSCQRRSDHATQHLVDAGGRHRRGIEQCRAVLPDPYTGRAGWSQSDAPRPLAAGCSSGIRASGGR